MASLRQSSVTSARMNQHSIDYSDTRLASISPEAQRRRWCRTAGLRSMMLNGLALGNILVSLGRIGLVGGLAGVEAAGNDLRASNRARGEAGGEHGVVRGGL